MPENQISIDLAGSFIDIYARIVYAVADAIWEFYTAVYPPSTLRI